MKKWGVVPSVATVLLALVSAASAGMWRESSVADFTDGTYNANVFASTEGSDNGTMKSAPGAFYDLNKDGRPDIIICNLEGSSTYIYWGKHDWTYSADSCQALPSSGSTGSSVADIDRDGNLDLLISNFYGSYSFVYWGSHTGFHDNDTTLLAATGGHGNCIVDLNHDGAFELLVSSMYGTEVYVFWGNKTDRRHFQRTSLRGFSSSDIAVADLNNDGLLDIVVPNKQGNYPPAGGVTCNIPSYIYWGQRLNDSIYYSTAAMDSLETYGTYCVSIGDVDRNGWLDIVFSNHKNDVTYNVDSYVYWGSDTGFCAGARTGLATHSAIGNAIVDLDKDGHQDIVFANWYNDVTHDVPSYVYWGPDFSSRTELPTHGGHGALIGKLSNNSVNDVLVTNAYGGWSYIFHGVSRSGYDGYDSLPSSYGHISTKDNGNVHDRGASEEYLSSVFGDGSATQAWNSCSWTADVPAGAALEVALRGGDTPVPDLSWSAWQAAAPGKAPLAVPPSKYLQYRLTSTANDLFQAPAVDEVAVDFTPQGVAGGPGAAAPSVTISADGRGVVVSLALARAGRVRVSVYNMLGQAVATLADGVLAPGAYRYDWRGRGVASGVYLCSVEAGGARAVRRFGVVR